MASQRIAHTLKIGHNLNFDALSAFDPVFYFGNNNTSGNQILALGSLNKIPTSSNNQFDNLKIFCTKNSEDWRIGWICYDKKNELEELGSFNDSYLNCPEMMFVQPKIVFEIIDSKTVTCHYFETDYSILSVEVLTKKIWSKNTRKHSVESIEFKPSLNKEEYIRRVEKVKAHIKRGDIYEANFCQIFTGKGLINPYNTFERLLKKSPTPFAVFVKYQHYYTLCASPERFLKKEACKIITEPIKGTIARKANKTEDLKQIETLKNSVKDQTENIMVVDLARNDLSKIAKKNSVFVDELFGIYSFPQVHQMISRITASVDEKTDNVDILKALFPIASMTGVPKISALKIIEELEDFKRELYAGCIGYFSPNNNFDFNVVIRSLFYNANTKTLSYAVGGAIIDASNPEEEYNETLLKAKALRGLFN